MSHFIGTCVFLFFIFGLPNTGAVHNMPLKLQSCYLMRRVWCVFGVVAAAAVAAVEAVEVLVAAVVVLVVQR